MRGLSLSRPLLNNASSDVERAVRVRQAPKLTMGPRRGLVSCNGRAGHVQVHKFGAVATYCCCWDLLRCIRYSFRIVLLVEALIMNSRMKRWVAAPSSTVFGGTICCIRWYFMLYSLFCFDWSAITGPNYALAYGRKA